MTSPLSRLLHWTWKLLLLWFILGCLQHGLIYGQLRLLCAQLANVFFLLFVVVKRCICCTFRAQACGDQGAHLDLPLKWRRAPSVSAACMSVYCMCTRSEVSKYKAMLSSENQPQCMLGRRGVMTEKDLELLQGPPADITSWHQQRQLVRSNPCHTAT